MTIVPHNALSCPFHFLYSAIIEILSRNSPALQRYKITTKTNQVSLSLIVFPHSITHFQDNLTEEDIEKLKVARAESRKFALSSTSLTSSKTQKLWESLDDIEVIRGQVKIPYKVSIKQVIVHSGPLSCS